MPGFLFVHNAPVEVLDIKLSTVTQLIALIIFSLSLSLWGISGLLGMAVLLIFILSKQESSHFFKLLKRLKWVFILMFLIPALSTPGEHVWLWTHSIKLTYEGLAQGATQVLRIVNMLAALSIVLAHNSAQQFVSGLYVLLQPLTILGFNVKRFAVRLWLTLYYVDQQENVTLTGRSLTERLNEAFVEDKVSDVTVTLEKAKMIYIDYIVIGAMLLLLIVTLVVKGY